MITCFSFVAVPAWRLSSQHNACNPLHERGCAETAFWHAVDSSVAYDVISELSGTKISRRTRSPCKSHSRAFLPVICHRPILLIMLGVPVPRQINVNALNQERISLRLNSSRGSHTPRARRSQPRFRSSHHLPFAGPSRPTRSSSGQAASSLPAAGAT